MPRRFTLHGRSTGATASRHTRTPNRSLSREAVAHDGQQLLLCCRHGRLPCVARLAPVLPHQLPGPGVEGGHSGVLTTGHALPQARRKLALRPPAEGQHQQLLGGDALRVVARLRASSEQMKWIVSPLQQRGCGGMTRDPSAVTTAHLLQRKAHTLQHPAYNLQCSRCALVKRSAIHATVALHSSAQRRLARQASFHAAAPNDPSLLRSTSEEQAAMSCSRGCFASACCREHDERLIQWRVGRCPLFGREVRRHSGSSGSGGGGSGGRWRGQRALGLLQLPWTLPGYLLMPSAAVRSAQGRQHKHCRLQQLCRSSSCYASEMFVPRVQWTASQRSLQALLRRMQPALSTSQQWGTCIALSCCIVPSDLRSISSKHSGGPKWTWRWTAGRKCRRRAPKGIRRNSVVPGCATVFWAAGARPARPLQRVPHPFRAPAASRAACSAASDY